MLIHVFFVNRNQTMSIMWTNSVWANTWKPHWRERTHLHKCNWWIKAVMQLCLPILCFWATSLIALKWKIQSLRYTWVEVEDLNNMIWYENLIFLQLKIVNDQCNAEKSKHVIDLEITAAAPAIFVYLELTNNEIERHSFSANGFIQVTPSQRVTISMRNTRCSTKVSIDDFKILSVNEFLLKKQL